MRRLPLLLAVLVASACGGDSETVTVTVTATTASGAYSSRWVSGEGARRHKRRGHRNFSPELCV
jgi:uncharacterized protein YodC (DUF2158 family)